MYILTPLGNLELYSPGPATAIWRTQDAIASWANAVAAVDDKKRDAQEAQLIGRLEVLGEAGRLRSPDHMNHEGDQVYAVKSNGGLRAYGWFTQINNQRAFVIAHTKLKKTQKLDPADREQVSSCREAISTSLQATNRPTQNGRR